MTHRFSLSLILTAALALSACDSVQESVGSFRKGPDEFRVTSRPPLTVPPEFALRPPAESEDAQSARSAAAEARAAVLGEQTSGAVPAIGVESLPAVSPADQALLEKAGATRADPAIRKTLSAEERQATAAAKEKEEGFFSSVLPARKSHDKIVDAPKEAERIQDAKKQGAPVTKGETPTKKEKSGGIFGTMF